LWWCIFARHKKGRWGCIIRDHKGEFIAARVGAGALHQLSNALHGEALACLNGLQLASSLGMQSVILETDAQILAFALTSSTYDRSFLEVKSRIYFDFFCCKIFKCSRTWNADVLASYGATLDASESGLWPDQAPEFVSTMVSGLV
jgi:hypothetical protein